MSREVEDKFDDNEPKNTRAKKKSHKGLVLYSLCATIAAGALFYQLYETRKTLEQKEEDLDTHTSVEDYNKRSEGDVKKIIKDYMENQKGVLPMVREVFQEDVVINHGGKYLFYPIVDGLKKNTIDNSKLKEKDNGEITYEDKDITGYKTIDVSKFQGEIDWNKVAASGVKYAIIRVGFRGYGSGELVEDEFAKKNLENATKAGIKVGVYFFSQAITTEEAEEEAKFVTDIISPYKIDCPVYFDTEDVAEQKERAESISVSERTKIAKTFMKKIKKSGYTPGIYANIKWYFMALDLSELDEYEKWYASYDKSLYFPYEVNMWQYSESGTVDGITGKVDLNLSFKKW